MQYTLPGVPLVFYGDEAGLEGYEDPFNRRCYPWGKEDKNHNEFFRTLGKIRKNLNSVLADGTYAPVTAKNGLLIYERYNQNGTIKVIANAQKTEYVLDEIVHDEITNSDLKVLTPHSAIIIKC